MPINRAITASWRDAFICTAEIVIPGERSAVYRAAERGSLVRVSRGVFLSIEYWNALTTVEARHLARIRSIALTHPGAVFSHASAAVLWQVPVVGVALNVPHVVSGPAGGGRSKAGITRHCVGVPDQIDIVDGIRVTTLARTVVDVAATSSVRTGVVAADFVLRAADPVDVGVRRQRVTREELETLLALVPRNSGSARCRATIEFADGRSGSPGESVSRTAIQKLGFPAPELQVPFFDRRGLIGIVDFWWPDFRLIGEFDGAGKYLRDEFLHGRTPGEAVVEEKIREDRLRATDCRVARWGWAEAMSTSALRPILVKAGLRAL